jgi:alpha-beta hydrolase superfamily lysophospholipase
MLSGFPMPRSAHGDAAVCWATSFAQLGYPTFRVDLPGFGDSRGAVPAELLQYLTGGGYEKVTADLVELIVTRYALTGIVILGQCGGAISAIFAAPISSKCQGLILIEPPFSSPPAPRPEVKRALYQWLIKYRVGGCLRNAYDQVRKLKLQLRKNAPPENANFQLLKRWKQVASAGMPILLLYALQTKSADNKSRAGSFDYLKHILTLAGSRCRVDVRFATGANHSFSNSAGKSAVAEHVADWMLQFFPFDHLPTTRSAFAEEPCPRDEIESRAPQPILASVEVSCGIES